MKKYFLYILIIITIIRIWQSFKNFDYNQSMIEDKVSYQGILQIDSEISKTNSKTVFFASSIENSRRHKVELYMHETIQYGDCIYVDGNIIKPQNNNSLINETLYEFPYKEYLAKDKVYSIFKVKKYNKDNTEKICNELNVFKKIKLFFILQKQKLITMFLEKYEQPYAGLVAGVLVAGKGLMSKDTLELFKKVSLSHVIVLSGSNVSIIIFCISALFGFLLSGFRENIFTISLKKFLIILSVTSFVLLTGGGAPIYRAYISSCCALLIFKKGINQIYALTIVILIMTIINPFESLYDPSFHLTCLATYGLILFSKYFDKIMIFSFLNMMPNFLREIVSVTLATQVFVFPYIIYMSGSFSTVFLLSNTLILPLLPLVMLFGFLSLFRYVDVFFIFINNILLKIIFYIVEWVSMIPYAYVLFDKKISASILVVYGVFLLWLFSRVRKWGGV